MHEACHQLNHVSTGSTYDAVATEDVGNLLVETTSPGAQCAIADYLDRETARLDALVAAKERVLGLLAEKRRALITRAVTRGLNPNVPFRDSGIPWLGEIPAHWETERARWLFGERDQRSYMGEEELLTVSHLTGVTRRSEKDVNMFEAETTKGYKSPFSRAKDSGKPLIPWTREKGWQSPKGSFELPPRAASLVTDRWAQDALEAHVSVRRARRSEIKFE